MFNRDEESYGSHNSFYAVRFFCCPPRYYAVKMYHMSLNKGLIKKLNGCNKSVSNKKGYRPRK